MEKPSEKSLNRSERVKTTRDRLLDDSWIDPFSKSANLNKEAEATLTDRRGLFAVNSFTIAKGKIINGFHKINKIG